MNIQILNIDTAPSLIGSDLWDPFLILNTEAKNCEVRPCESFDLTQRAAFLKYIPIQSVEESQLEHYLLSSEFSKAFHSLSLCNDYFIAESIIQEIQDCISQLEPSRWQVATAEDFAYEQLQLAEGPIDSALLKRLENWLNAPRSVYLILTHSDGSALETSCALLRALQNDLPSSFTYDELRIALEPCILSESVKLKTEARQYLVSQAQTSLKAGAKQKPSW